MKELGLSKDVIHSDFIIGSDKKDPNEVIKEFIQGMKQVGQLVIECNAFKCNQQDIETFQETTNIKPIKEGADDYFYMEDNKKMYMFFLCTKIDAKIVLH